MTNEKKGEAMAYAYVIGWILVTIGVWGMFGPWAAITIFGLILMVSCLI